MLSEIPERLREFTEAQERLVPFIRDGQLKRVYVKAG